MMFLCKVLLMSGLVTALHCFTILNNVTGFHIDPVQRAAERRAAGNSACDRYERLKQQVTSYRARNEQLLLCKLLREYEPHIRPYAHGINKSAAIEVKVSLELTSISTVSVTTMDFVAQFRFQQEWFDSRLRFSSDQYYFRVQSYVNLAHDHLVWRPDTFFQNEKNGWDHQIVLHNRVTRVRFDGYVEYNRRLTLTCSCTMKLRKYPMDTQKCEIEFASYAYTEHEIYYVWRSPSLTVSSKVDEVLPNFRISNIRNGTCTSNTTTGNYSCLKIEFILERELSYFALQIYCPCVMLVCVSWVSYWIDWQTPAARAPLTIVTLLTMITTQQSISKNLPPVSYTKAIDIWTGGCVLFIFGALIEYAIVNFVGMAELKRMGRRHRISALVKRMTDAGCSALTTSVADMGEEHHKLKAPVQVPHWSLRTTRQRHVGLRSIQQPIITENQMDSVIYEEHSRMQWKHNPDDMSKFVRVRRDVRVRWLRAWHSVECMLLCERIDLFARLLTPVLFLLFNITYWIVYAFSADEKLDPERVTVIE